MKVNIGEFPNDPKKPRKIEVRIDPWDTWNLDHTLACIIYPALLQIRENKHGIPGVFVWDAEGNERPEGEAQAAWLEVLDKMIFSFKEIRDGKPGKSEALKSKKKGPNGEEAPRPALDAYQAKIDEGLRLFAQYFEALWT